MGAWTQRVFELFFGARFKFVLVLGFGLGLFASSLGFFPFRGMGGGLVMLEKESECMRSG